MTQPDRPEIRATVERFRCAGPQTLPCGHRLERGDTGVQVTPSTGRALSMCPACFDQFGREHTLRPA